METSTIQNRREWLKRSALLGGSLFTTLALSETLAAKAAFGMKPVYKQSIKEQFTAWPNAMAEVKARLSANENPWGPSKKAVSAIVEYASSGNRYARESMFKMMKMVAKKEGVSEDNVVLAPGSTDILEKTALASCMKGGNVISADPSYMSLVNTAQKIGATWKNIPLKSDYSHDLDAMAAAIDADTKLIYICNPNNPTGTLTSAAELKAFCAKVSSKVPVFIDEAYLELTDDFAGMTMTGMIREGHDVIVARTFSKIHGMAGLRMGYMIAKPERIESIRQMVRTEMGICVTSAEGAMASMDDVTFLDSIRKNNKEARDYVYSELKKAGMSPIPSVTSFILFPLAMPAKDFVGKMMERGVSIRGYTINDKPYGRVSMGTKDEIQLFVKSLNEIV